MALLVTLLSSVARRDWIRGTWARLHLDLDTFEHSVSLPDAEGLLVSLPPRVHCDGAWHDARPGVGRVQTGADASGQFEEAAMVWTTALGPLRTAIRHYTEAGCPSVGTDAAS